MKYILVLFLSLLFQSAFSQKKTTYYKYGIIKSKGYYKKGKAFGNFITYDSIGDTLSVYHYKKGKANGPFLVFYIGKNFKSKYVHSKLDNYSETREEKMKIVGSYHKGEING